MNIFVRLSVWLACAIGLFCLYAPVSHAIKIYELSYSGPTCQEGQERDCLKSTATVISDKRIEKSPDSEGVTTSYYVQTDLGEYGVEKDFYEYAQKNDSAQVTSLNGKYVSISIGVSKDRYDADQRNTAMLWAAVMGALLLAFSASTIGLFAREVSYAGPMLLVCSPTTCFFGFFVVGILMAISDATGIFIGWTLAVITGIVAALGSTRRYL